MRHVRRQRLIRRHVLPLHLERLECRAVPSGSGLANPRQTWVPPLMPSSADLPNPPPAAAPAPPAFDAATGLALPGNKARISDPLLQLFNAWQVAVATREPLVTPDELLQVTAGGEVFVRITGHNVAALRPALAGMGYRMQGERPELRFTEGWLPIAALPAAEALSAQGLLGIVPVRRPGTGVGLTDNQADWHAEADRVRGFGLPNYTGATVRVGVMSDSYNIVGGAGADVASADLPAAGVKVWQEGPAGSTDEGRAMLQLVHDVATGSPLSFASTFYGEADFAAQIQVLANPAQGNCKVLSDDIFYYEEPMYQDGVIAQAIDDVVVNRDVSYFALAGNHADDGYESTAWRESNADPAYTRTFDFNPAAGVDTRQRITIGTGNFARLVFQWDDPFYTAAGVDTDLDIYLFRADTGVQVASATDSNIATQVPSELLNYTNNTGQSQFDVVIRRFAGPNPGRFKWVHLGNGVGITINEYFDPNIATVTPHAAATWAQGVGAVPWYNRAVPEAFTCQGGNTYVFDAAGNPIAPLTRPGVYLAAFDRGNTTFFGNDSAFDADAFPNFSGTSAAAPNAAAVAALLLDAEPTLSPLGVYIRMESTADDSVHTAGFDNKTGAGVVNAFQAIFGNERLPSGFTDDLESSRLSKGFETKSYGPGRILVDTGNGPASGTFHVTMASETAGINALNELILHVNLQHVNNAVLSFQQKEFNDEDHAMPASFMGAGNYDGVALSVDGDTWYRLASLTGLSSTNVYQPFAINLQQVATANALSLGTDVYIKFQQFDDNVLGSDGFAFDDIQVVRAGTISGVAYSDGNVNGKNDGEAGLGSRVVYLDDNANGRFDYANLVSYASPQMPVRINDLGTVRVPLTIAGIGGTVADVDVALDISHTWDSDLDVFLISPAGTRVMLFTDVGDLNNHFTNTTLDDEAATQITAGAAPFTGRFQPEGLLSAIDGEAISGTWYLEITDDEAGIVGTLNSWSLTVARRYANATKVDIDGSKLHTSDIVVSGLAGNITDIDVNLDIAHTWDEDLDVFLVGAGGKSIELFTDVGGSLDNFLGTLDDEAATAVTAGVAPFTGRYRPEGKLADFDGLAPNATWQLQITDDVPIADNGMLNSWSLDIGRTYSQNLGAVAVPDLGTKSVAIPVGQLGGTIVDLDVTLDLAHTFVADCDVFLTSPAGTKVELFTDVGRSGDNVTNTILDDQAGVTIAAERAPFTGRFRPEGALAKFNGEDPNGTWTLSVTDDNATELGSVFGFSLTFATTSSFTLAPGLAINDYKTASSTIKINGIEGLVNDINVQLDVTHTWDEDLVIFLTAPDGSKLDLIRNVGGSNNNFTGTTLDDEALTLVTSGAAPFTGSFRPQQPLAFFDGLNPNGNWRLQIYDGIAGDKGTLNSWGITLTTGDRFDVTGKLSGDYQLENLPAGSYQVREVRPTGWRRTEPLPMPDQYDLTIDNAGATAFSGKNFGSVADNTAPTVTFTPVSPDPRNAPVTSIAIVFSEAVTGLDIADLALTRNGGANLLPGAATLSTADNITWTLGNLAGLTGTAGNYSIALDAAETGIQDLAFIACTAVASDSWTMDKTAPVITSVVVNSGAAQRSMVRLIEVNFSELIGYVGAATDAFTLTGPAGDVALTLNTIDGGGFSRAQLTFLGAGATLGSLDDGNYILSVTAGQVRDAASNSVAGFSTPAAPDPGSIHRLFGDSDGDNDVDTTDYAAFRAVYGGASSIFDFDNDGDVDTSDFGQFRARFGSSL